MASEVAVMPKQEVRPVQSVWDVIFVDDERGLEGASQDVGGAQLPELLRRGVSHPPGGVAPLVRRQVAGAARHALKQEQLIDAFLRVWTTYADVLQAARRTRENPGSTETVPLAKDTLRSQHQVDVEVLLDEKTLTTIQFGVDLELVVEAALIVVSAGRFEELRAGRATATGTLLVEGKAVLTKEQDLDLPWLLDQDPKSHVVEQEIRLPGQPGVDSRSSA